MHVVIIKSLFDDKVYKIILSNFIDFIVKALVAETIVKEEAMDLFRHTTELATHVSNNVARPDGILVHCSIYFGHETFSSMFSNSRKY